MELPKPAGLQKYTEGDVTFIYKGTMTARDKTEMNLAGQFRNGKFVMTGAMYVAKIIELFVVGWEGVTEDGKPVPYSFETLCERMPPVGTDILLHLADAIGNQVGAFAKKEEAERKNV